jgi:hypothetical protein
MKTTSRALAIAAVQLALLGLVGGKLYYDRAALPRAWIETAGLDPDLPIRGRYVALNLVPPVVEEAPIRADVQFASGRIELRDGRAVAVLADGGGAASDATHPLAFVRNVPPGTEGRWRTRDPVALFLPEHARDPTLGRRPGELWVEATLPERGAPRPIRLGLKHGDRIEPMR